VSDIGYLSSYRLGSVLKAPQRAIGCATTGGVMNRRDAMQGIATALLAPCWPVGRALAAGLGFAWGVVPTIAVVGAADDPRQALVRDAIAFWNQTLGELRSGFRLGAVAWQDGSVPDDLIVALSESTLKGMKRPFPERLGSIPGEIVVALSDADFISFSMHWSIRKGLVAIKSGRVYPLTLPNVARNVVAHELGTQSAWLTIAIQRC
jgi:hypothetical protein